MAVFIALLLGLVLGSFLCVLLTRWPQQEGTLTGRSRCPHCMHELAWYDLIPLGSWLALRGRCRYCSAPIPAFYPALELVMAGALGGYVAASGFLLPRDAFMLPIIALLVAHFFFDLKWQVLPDAITALLTALALGRLFVVHPFPWLNGLAAGIFASAVVLLVYVITKGNGIGFGDVKLAFPLGLLFGAPRLLGVVLTAVWAGALLGVVLLLLRKASLKTALPFGSFWTAAALAAFIWPAVADWPLRLLQR